MRICYCEDCGVRVPDEDISSGAATALSPDTFRCAKCSVAKAPPKTPATSRVQKVVTAGHVLARTAPPASTSSKVRPAVSSTKASISNHALLMAAGGTALALIGISIVLLAGKKKSPENPAPVPGPVAQVVDLTQKKVPPTAPQQARPADPSAQEPKSGTGLLSTTPKPDVEDDSPREAAARRKFDAAKAFLKQHPDDPWTYSDMLADLVAGSRSTAAGKEAAKVQADLKLAPRITAPRAHWKFDEDSGTEAKDAAGANHATLKGQAKRVAGRSGRGAIALTGNQEDYIDLGSAPALNFAAGSPFTITGWVRTSAEYGMILSFRNSADDTPDLDIAVGFHGATTAAGCLLAIVRQDGAREGFANITGGQINNGAWRHFAVTRGRDGTVRLFLDGALQGAQAAASSGGSLTTDLRAIGGERYWSVTESKAHAPDRRGFKGEVDDFRIYSFALSESELRGIMNAK
jgi:hypothetical protein